MEVILVDDHVAMRDGLKELLGRRGIETIGTAADATEAITLLETRRPDIVIVDLNLPDESGLHLTRRISVADPTLPVMIYTGSEDIDTLGQALECGARGLALKLGGITKLIQGLRLLARGERYVDPAFTALLDSAPGERRPLLTRREREVFDLLAQGLTGEEIAGRLVVSHETVRTHVRNGMRKLGARTRAGAVVRALAAREIDA